MIPTDLFTDLADFRGFVNGLEADTSFAQLSTSIRAAARQVANSITPEVFEAIASLAPSLVGEAPEQLALLKAAVAAGAMHQYQIFASVKKNKTDGSLYKYQHEEIKEHYVNAYWLAMDELLEWLDANPGTGGYSETSVCKERWALPIRNAREFNEYFGIDSSAYFYSKVLFLLRSIWKNTLRPMLPPDWDSDPELGEKVRRTLCYHTVAEAVIKFDVTELPRSIRYDFNHEYTKGSSMQAREKLHADLMGDVKAWTLQIDNLVKASAGATSLQQNPNREGNKFYLL